MAEKSPNVIILRGREWILERKRKMAKRIMDNEPYGREKRKLKGEEGVRKKSLNVIISQ